MNPLNLGVVLGFLSMLVVQGLGEAAAPPTADPSAGSVSVRFDPTTGLWVVEGRRHRLECNPTNLACRVVTPVVDWRLRPSELGLTQDVLRVYSGW